MREPVVVGAFPEPFVHGFNGKRRPARVVYFVPGQRVEAERVALLVHGEATRDVREARAKHWNLVVLAPTTGRTALKASFASPRPGSPVVFVFAGNPALLLAKPPFGHRRYEVP